MTMPGRVCLVTGATSGIGKATAHALARLGASVVILGRRPAELDAVAAEMRADTGNDVTVLLADLASLESIRQAADRFRAEHDRAHVLINNAGVNLNHRSLTVDGFETTFAVNHLAPLLLTNLLLDVLRHSAPSRVVTVTSTAFRRGRIDFDDLHAEQRFSGFRAYSQSKLANVLFTNELARRLEGTGVTANCVHPGVVRGTALGHGNRTQRHDAPGTDGRVGTLRPPGGGLRRRRLSRTVPALLNRITANHDGVRMAGDDGHAGRRGQHADAVGGRL